MKKWQIWSEGYLATGQEGIPAQAQLRGTADGETFDDAVERFVATLPPDQAKFFSRSPYGYWVEWGCRLFDNEAEARKSFG